jgi:hypothetical protein
MNEYSGAVVLFVLLIVGCNGDASTNEVPDDWIPVEAKDAFSFRAPPDLVEHPVQGKDSFVGKYDSPTLELSFDFGRYSDPLEREDYKSWKFRKTTIDGKRAKIGHSDSRMAIHFPQVIANTKVGDIKLSLFAKLKQPEAKETAETIFRSIDFP